MPPRLTSIELFTGAGGLALGVAKAGYHHLALVERDRNAVASLNANRRRVRVMNDWPKELLEMDVHSVEFKQHSGAVDLLAAGAPCQPFSLGGKHKGHADERNLFPEVFRAVRETKPRALVVENVKGLLRTTFKEYFDYILAQAAHPSCAPKPQEEWRTHRDRLARYAARNDAEYVVNYALLNAANYGVPQKRERVFIVALEAKLGAKWLPPKASHSEDALYYDQYVSGAYWAEHGLPRREAPPKLELRVTALSGLPRPDEKRWQTVRDAIRGLVAPPAAWDGNGSDPDHVARPGARSYKGHCGSPLDAPSKTLKAGDHGVPGGENTVVDDTGAIRYLTVREAARIQTFPDEFRFAGAWTEGFRQLGNAVPVKLAEAVATSVAKQLR
jgi:DNA (cytosine-5)-methyltransferase 1